MGLRVFRIGWLHCGFRFLLLKRESEVRKCQRFLSPKARDPVSNEHQVGICSTWEFKLLLEKLVVIEKIPIRDSLFEFTYGDFQPTRESED